MITRAFAPQQDEYLDAPKTPGRQAATDGMTAELESIYHMVAC